MAKFHGQTNLHLGAGEDAWADAQYDHDSLDYVIDVSGDALKRFRAVADEYGFVEEDAPETKPAEAKPAKKAAAAKADKDA